MADSGGGGGLIPILGSIFNAILGGVDGNIQLAFDYTASWLNNLLHNLVGILKSIAGFFKNLAGAIGHLWKHYIQSAIQWIADHLKKLYDWLRREGKTLVAWAKKIKKWYDEHILPFQLKQLAMIQRIRQILGILKAFHVKWATTLDQKLGDLQSRIVGTIDLIRGALNSIINFCNLLYDPTLLMRRTALGGSLLASIGATKRILGFGSGLGYTSAQAAQMQKDQQMYTKSTVTGNISTRAQTGLTSDDRQARSDFQSALSATTGVSL